MNAPTTTTATHESNHQGSSLPEDGTFSQPPIFSFQEHLKLVEERRRVSTLLLKKQNKKKDCSSPETAFPCSCSLPVRTYSPFSYEVVLSQAVRNAGQRATGIVWVEVWVWDACSETLVRQAEWIDPSFHSYQSCNNPASCSVCPLTNSLNKDYYPVEPLCSGAGLAGVMWAALPHSGAPRETIAWRHVEHLASDARIPWDSRLQLVSDSGVGWVAVAPFYEPHASGYQGVVVYMAEKDVALSELRSPFNRTVLELATITVGLAASEREQHDDHPRRSRSNSGDSLSSVSSETFNDEFGHGITVIPASERLRVILPFMRFVDTSVIEQGHSSASLLQAFWLPLAWHGLYTAGVAVAFFVALTTTAASCANSGEAFIMS